jgi:hypothetical protein
MQHFAERARSTFATRRHLGPRHWGLGMAALLVVGLLVPAPGNVTVAAIAAAGLFVMGAQHVIFRRLIAESAELITTQEALLAGVATSRRRLDSVLTLAGAEATRAGRDGVHEGTVRPSRAVGARASGRRLAA